MSGGLAIDPGFPTATRAELDVPPRTVLAEDAYPFGELSLRLVPDQPVFMDGGAMFGVVPKSLWVRHKVPDARNRVPVATNCLLVQGPQGTSLVEGGVGDKYSDRERDIFGLEDAGRLRRSLAATGVEPEEVDHVFLTHLHFDHCGAVTTFDGGSLRPTFPRARHFVQRREYEILLDPDGRSLASYSLDNLAAVRDAGLLELVDGDAEPVPGFRLRHTPGHTPGHQVVLVDSSAGTLAFMGDLVPYVSHLKSNWVAATDVEPLVNLQTKARFLAEARAGGWTLVLYHEHLTPVGRLQPIEEGRSGDAGEGFVPF
jgi:glyoxylase-like metal-dependent hydrolase (beta-lactamase superfamily II)